MRKLLIGTVVPAIVLGVILGVSRRDSETRKESPPTEYKVQPTPAETIVSPPPSADPRFENSADRPPLTGSEKERNLQADREATAQRVVYDRCSKFAVWREGSVLDGTYAFRKNLRAPELVNVSVKLARPQVANGHTLFYQVRFEKGRPATITANKSVSAELCGLDEEGVAFPL